MNKPVEIRVPEYDLDILIANADKRAEIHEHHATSRPLSNDYELIGLLGEYAFQMWSGKPMDFTIRPGGDDKIDFILHTGITVDVKSARKAYNLFRECGKKHADILVLAHVHSNELVSLLGWEYGVIMAMQPSKEFGYGIRNHYMPARSLKPMSKLKDLWLGEARGEQYVGGYTNDFS